MLKVIRCYVHCYLSEYPSDGYPFQYAVPVNSPGQFWEAWKENSIAYGKHINYRYLFDRPVFNPRLVPAQVVVRSVADDVIEPGLYFEGRFFGNGKTLMARYYDYEVNTENNFINFEAYLFTGSGLRDTATLGVNVNSHRFKSDEVLKFMQRTAAQRLIYSQTEHIALERVVNDYLALQDLRRSMQTPRSKLYHAKLEFSLEDFMKAYAPC